MKSKNLLTAVFAIWAATIVYANPPEEEGKTIFTSRCAACHNVNKVLTGPALAGVDQRRSIEWIVKFVKSSQGLVKSGDKDAVALFEKFNRIPMPDHPDLTADNISSIVEFIKSEAKPIDEGKAPFAKPTKKEPAYRPLSLSEDYVFFLVYLAVIAMLIAVLLFAVKLNSFKSN